MSLLTTCAKAQALAFHHHHHHHHHSLAIHNETVFSLTHFDLELFLPTNVDKISDYWNFFHFGSIIIIYRAALYVMKMIQ